MQRTLEIAETHLTIGEMIRDVVAEGAEIIVEQDGKPVAAVVPMELYQRLRRREIGDLFQAMAERADMDPEEAEVLAAEAVRWARNNKGA